MTDELFETYQRISYDLLYLVTEMMKGGEDGDWNECKRKVLEYLEEDLEEE